MHIQIKKGLDIPLLGEASGKVYSAEFCDKVGLDLSPFFYLRTHLVVEEGQRVKKGEVLAEDRACSLRKFISPASGVIEKIERGYKRSLSTLVIKKDREEEEILWEERETKNKSPLELIDLIFRSGLSPYLKMRPFDIAIFPDRPPRSIFIKALESAPFVPDPALQVEGKKEEFHKGWEILSQIVKGKVHLMCRKDSIFSQWNLSSTHTASGPHPIANLSVAIEAIDPILSEKDCVWTIDVQGVIAIGERFLSGKYYTERVVAIAGLGFPENRRGFYKMEMGRSIEGIIKEFSPLEEAILISGDPLTGTKVEQGDFLGFFANAVCAFSKEKKRSLFPFLGIGKNRFTATKTYLSGFLSREKKYPFTTRLQGEPRPFIDGKIYQKVMPLPIPVIQLIKAILTNNDTLAKELGLLEIASEDFSLPTFIDPSKNEMSSMVRDYLLKLAAETFRYEWNL